MKEQKPCPMCYVGQESPGMEYICEPHSRLVTEMMPSNDAVNNIIRGKCSGTSLANKTPSEQAKAAGLKSLAKMSQMVGKPTETLRNWHRDSPELFRILLAGCVLEKGR